VPRFANKPSLGPEKKNPRSSHGVEKRSGPGRVRHASSAGVAVIFLRCDILSYAKRTSCLCASQGFMNRPAFSGAVLAMEAPPTPTLG
jgi:hypothetical protein